ETYQQTLARYDLTQTDIEDCLNHYKKHQTFFRVPFIGWKEMDDLKNHPHFAAEQLMKLFGMYQYNFRHPTLLEGLASISFDPLNRAVVEDHLLKRKGKRYLDAIWQEVNAYLTKVDNGDDRLRSLTDLWEEPDPIDWFVDGVFAKGALS